MRNDLLAYIVLLSSSYYPPTHYQYTYFDDDITYFREGTRDGWHVLDQVITVLGFEGIENIDWKLVYRDKIT